MCVNIAIQYLFRSILPIGKTITITSKINIIATINSTQWSCVRCTVYSVHYIVTMCICDTLYSV